MPMESVTGDDIIQAIDQYLNDLLQSKLEPEQKKLEKVEPGSEQAQQISETIAKIRIRYSKANWLDTLANKHTPQIKFGTHISKGVHPDSKGDNVNFRSSNALPAGLVGTQLLSDSPLDANGNAAALPLVGFLNYRVKSFLFRDLILAKHPALAGVLPMIQRFLSTISNSSTPHWSHKRILRKPLVATNNCYGRWLMPLQKITITV